VQEVWVDNVRAEDIDKKDAIEKEGGGRKEGEEEDEEEESTPLNLKVVGEH